MDTTNFTSGKADLKSAGALAFGTDGVLFVGDTAGAAIFALDTGDKSGRAAAVEVAGINQKIAALLGITPDQLQINDVAVNPASGRVYLSVSRGRGPDAIPVLLRTDAGGKLEEVALNNIRHSRVSLANVPAADAPRNGRRDSITDIAYADGRVWVAGLSNEEFASKLRSIAFPFKSADQGASIEIFHGNHGRLETNSPVRTFVPYSIKNEQHILAAYTCTPLVKIPVSQLKAGSKVTGTTIAELGNGNTPMDMIVYKKGGADYILMNNTRRGVMKMSTEKIETYGPITQKTDIAGLPYTSLTEWKGVQQLDRLNDTSAVLLVQAETGSMDLKTVALP
jgi:hypothetical protein